MLLDKPTDGLVDVLQPHRQLVGRNRLEAAVVDQSELAAVALDDPVAGGGSPGIDAQDDQLQGGRFGQDLGGQVEIGGHALYVVEVLEVLDQAQVLVGDVEVDIDGRLGCIATSADLDRHAVRLEPLLIASSTPAWSRPQWVARVPSAPASIAARATSSASRPVAGDAMTPRGLNCQAIGAAASWPPDLAKTERHRPRSGSVVGRGLDQDRHAAWP